MRFRLAGDGDVNRIRHNVAYVNALIDDTVYERGVGAILQKTTHEIRQQILVTADRRIYTTGVGEFPAVDELAVQVYSHTMKSLKFKVGP